MDGAAAEAERWLLIASKLLEARDLPAAKKFAERAIDADPLLEGPDQILAAADVLTASQRPLPSGQPDHYSILQLPPSSDLPSIKRSYRRLALLLRASTTNSAAFLALQLLTDSFSFLSDDRRRALYDENLVRVRPAGSSPPPRTPSPPPTPVPDTFWTVCPICFRAFEYVTEYEGRRLLCQVCRKGFQAARLPTPPPIVPGTDMFYCSWGLFPLGFPGGFSSVDVPPGTPSVAALPQAVPVNVHATGQADVGEETPTKRSSARLRSRTVTRDAPVDAGPVGATSRRKVMAKRPRRGQLEEDDEDGDEVVDNGGFDMNSSGAGGDQLDSQSLFGNMATFPFLKGDDVTMLR